SRNSYLSPDERRSALALSRALRAVEQAWRGGQAEAAALQKKGMETLAAPGVQPEYLALVDEALAPVERVTARTIVLVAARDGAHDQGVLDAVRYHSIGYAGWDEVGRMLYLADYLEPGRTFDREARRDLAARVPAERDAVLREVVRRRIEWTVRSGWPLREETVRFWNALVQT